jgi:hypothetical protein
VQEDIDASSFANLMWERLSGKDIEQDKNGKWQPVDVPGIGDEATWDLFAYSMKVTKEPQLVCIEDDNGGGHAMICYEISNGNLLVADPNYPGNTQRVIKYSESEFEPYNSGANADAIAKGKGTEYTTIQYFAKSTVLSWAKIADRWAQFQNGTIGDDKFPSYQLVTTDSEGKLKPLTDGYMSDSKNLYIGFTSQVSNISFYVLRDGKALVPVSPNTFALQPGNNKLGIYLEADVQETDSNGKTYTSEEYIDFKYINVYNSESATTTTTNKAATSAAPGALASLQESKSIFAHFIIAATIKSSSIGTSTPSSKQVDCSSDIVWNGTSFTGTETNGKDPVIHWGVNGTVAADGSTLLSLTITEDWTDSAGNSDHGNYSFSNVPIQSTSEYYGANAGKYMTDFQDSGTGHDTSGGQFTFSWSSPNTGDSRNQLQIEFETTPVEK